MWRKLTEDDLNATISRQEVLAYTSLEIFGDPVRYLLNDVAAWARTFIRSNGNVRMNPDETTLPASCISAAMDCVVIKVLKRIHKEPTDIRKQAQQDAIRFFNQIAKGEITPESYNAPESDATGGPAIETVTSMRRRTDGIEGF